MIPTDIQAMRHLMLVWKKTRLDGTMWGIKRCKATSWAFNVKNRFPRNWRDKQRIDFDTSNTISILIGGENDDKFSSLNET